MEKPWCGSHRGVRERPRATWWGDSGHKQSRSAPGPGRCASERTGGILRFCILLGKSPAPTTPSERPPLETQATRFSLRLSAPACPPHLRDLYSPLAGSRSRLRSSQRQSGWRTGASASGSVKRATIWGARRPVDRSRAGSQCWVRWACDTPQSLGRGRPGPISIRPPRLSGPEERLASRDEGCFCAPTSSAHRFCGDGTRLSVNSGSSTSRSACVGVQTGPAAQCQSAANVRRSGAGAPTRCMFWPFGWSGLRPPELPVPPK